MSYLRTSGAGARLRWAGLFGLIAALSLCLMPGVADAKKGKKKKDLVKVMTQNLYLGTDLNPLVAAANAGQPGPNATTAAAPDNFANEVGFGLKDVEANDFNVRAETIANEIKKNKVDLVGLQEAALWRLEVPTDGGGPPVGTFATVPLIDYIDTLLEALNQKAKTKKAVQEEGPQGRQVLPGLHPGGCPAGGRPRAVRRFRQRPRTGWNRRNRTGLPAPLHGCARGDTLAAAAAGYDDTGVSARDPGPGPAAANLDYNGDRSTPEVPPPNCNPLVPSFNPDPVGTSDCAGSDLGDTNPVGGNTPTCVIHGIDGDARLTMRDVIIGA